MEDIIDIVILWVDDQDMNWKRTKEFWQQEYGIVNDKEERYRNWDNLQYLFRGIEKYAPWVNHVFLVTDKQKPKWLNKDYDKVTIVDHKEIIDEEYLPTYNTNAIELNLHKINRLSENFLYFNDDMFLIDHTKKEDFFLKGVPKDTAASRLITPRKGQQIDCFIFNDLSIINHKFEKYQTLKNKPLKWFNLKYGVEIIKTLLLLPWPGFTGFYDPHICGSYNKKTFESVWQEHQSDLVETSKSKFREDHNYNQWLMRYWQLASNNFIPRRKSFGKFFDITDSDSLKRCFRHIEKQKSKVVCINDNEDLENFHLAKDQVNNALESLLPEKSRFEK